MTEVIIIVFGGWGRDRKQSCSDFGRLQWKEVEHHQHFLNTHQLGASEALKQPRQIANAKGQPSPLLAPAHPLLSQDFKSPLQSHAYSVAVATYQMGLMINAFGQRVDTRLNVFS